MNDNIIADFNSLHISYKKARRGKANNPTALRYGLAVVENTVALSRELSSRQYKPQPTYSFKVYEPKERNVVANSFRDKVVQHSLCDYALGPCLTPSFIRDSYASQIGKGTTDGLDRLAHFMRRHFFAKKAAADAERRAAGLDPIPTEQAGYNSGYVLKGDFAKYFYNILHEPLKDMASKKLRKRLPDAETADFVEWLLFMFMDSTPDPGLPIGFQSSQLLALLNLDGLDHLVKDKFGAAYYGRYMDDFYIIHEDKAQLKAWLAEIEKYIEPLGLRLNHKTQIFPLAHGIDFLGFHTYLTSSGKVVRKLRDDSKNNMRRRLKKYPGRVAAGKMTALDVKNSYESWCAHAEHGNTHHLRQNMDALYFGLFPELKPKKGAEANVSKNEQPERRR